MEGLADIRFEDGGKKGLTGGGGGVRIRYKGDCIAMPTLDISRDLSMKVTSVADNK